MAALVFLIDANSGLYIKHIEGTGCDGKDKGGGDWGEKEETGREARERQKGYRERERGSGTCNNNTLGTLDEVHPTLCTQGSGTNINRPLLLCNCEL